MSARAAWAGIIVGALERSVDWYRSTLGGRVGEESAGWASLEFNDGSMLELYEGDRAHPGRTFPSYGEDPGPPVLPGFVTDDPKEAADGLRIARSFPGWVVVVAPDGLRIVLLAGEPTAVRQLVSFRLASPDPPLQQAFLERIGVDVSVVEGPQPGVVPIFLGASACTLTDPDGNEIALEARS